MVDKDEITTTNPITAEILRNRYRKRIVVKKPDNIRSKHLKTTVGSNPKFELSR